MKFLIPLLILLTSSAYAAEQSQQPVNIVEARSEKLLKKMKDLQTFEFKGMTSKEVNKKFLGVLCEFLDHKNVKSSIRADLDKEAAVLSNMWDDWNQDCVDGPPDWKEDCPSTKEKNLKHIK